MSERTLAQAIGQGRLVAATPQDTIFETAKVMAAAGCGSALVLGADGRIEGIVTERDIMVRAVAAGLPPASTTVAAIMTAKPYCARPDMPVTHALMIMKEQGFRHIPVLGGNGLPLGVFSLRDAFPGEVVGADALIDACESLAERIA